MHAAGRGAGRPRATRRQGGAAMVPPTTAVARPVIEATHLRRRDCRRSPGSGRCPDACADATPGGGAGTAKRWQSLGKGWPAAGCPAVAAMAAGKLATLLACIDEDRRLPARVTFHASLRDHCHGQCRTDADPTDRNGQLRRLSEQARRRRARPGPGRHSASDRPPRPDRLPAFRGCRRLPVGRRARARADGRFLHADRR